MAYLVFTLIACALLVWFLVLTQYENRRGRRFFSERRDRFDASVRRIEFILEHVDFAAFARDEIRRAMNQIGHASAHLSLQSVRAVERLLTRLVRHFRSKHDVAVAPRENAREFVKTLSDFKENLKAPDDVGEIK